MSLLLAILISGALGFFVGRITDQRISPSGERQLEKLRAIARRSVASKSKRRLDHVYDLIIGEATKQQALMSCRPNLDTDYGILRQNVEDFFEVSASTARRYLRTLEKQGRISQTANTGRNVRYIPNIPTEELLEAQK